MPQCCNKEVDPEMRLDGKVVIVTGANAGIGFETSKDLASRGAKVIMACRSQPKAEEAKRLIVEETKNESVHFGKLDLASFKSIREFARHINETEERLDILIHNAGMVGPPKREVTEDGLEFQFQTNHFGAFLLNHLLLDLVKQTSNSRIIVLSSSMHKMGTLKNLEDLQSEKSYPQPWKIYSNTKLANVLFTRELAHRLEGTGVTANCCHPGAVKSNFQENISGIMGMLTAGMKIFFKTPKEGAKTSIFLAVSNKVENVSGKYFVDCKEANISCEAEDTELGKRLWDLSEKLVGIN